MPKDIDPTRDESKEGQSLALPVFTTSVNWAFPLSEKAYVLSVTKAKVKQKESEREKLTTVFQEVLIHFIWQVTI